ncbi:hypothetical protein F2Q69_00045581 [Brassica cretica]|uniref:SHSP domain-containing protein n=1 Tax=Brassica cretica TaxID=69181 RepID=A0A8S9NCV9_BRACR|nr:hypothetical protein F2Q69_00045581 [Brassica cretica]
MAARQQPRGTGLEVQYEDFVPIYEWEDQPEATILTIDLPGFTKEQLKANYTWEMNEMSIRVTGERPVTGRIWMRFNQVFPVPHNCLVDKITFFFGNNALTITMPKETIRYMHRHLQEASKTLAMEKQEEKERIRRKLQEEEAKAKKDG